MRRSAHICSLIAGGRPRSWVGVTSPVILFANIRRVPRKGSPIRQCQIKAREITKTAMRAYSRHVVLPDDDAGALPPFGLCGARLVDANRIGGARIVVCFHIYRSRSKEQKESIVVSIVQVKRYCHVTYATQFCGDAMLPSSCMHASPFGNTARDGKRSDATPLKQLGTTPCLALLVNFIRGF